MAPRVGFWRFLDEVQEMTMPMASIEWCKTPTIAKLELSPITVLFVTNPKSTAERPCQSDAINSAERSAAKVTADGEPSMDGDNSTGQGYGDSVCDRGQKVGSRQKNALTLGIENLVEKDDPAKINAHQLIEDLKKRNEELMQEKQNAVKWQDAATMAIKDAKDEIGIRKQEEKTAKKARLRATATLKQQLDDSKSQIEAFKKHKRLSAEEKTRTEVAHREEKSVAEAKIEELQTALNSANSNNRDSAEKLDELSRINKEMQVELAAKEQELAAQDRENQVLQNRIRARDVTIETVSLEAEKDREACNKYCKEKFESARAQQDAENKVGDLEREAVTVKANTDKATKSLQKKVDDYKLREIKADARAIKAEAVAGQLKRELDNTELARQNFEKREGEWAALFAAKDASTGTSSPSTRTVDKTATSETERRIPAATANGAVISKPAKKSPEKSSELLEKPEQREPDPDSESQVRVRELEAVVEDWKRAWTAAENGAEDWKRKVRRELNKRNQTALVTERENIRRELDEEKHKTLAAQRKIFRGKAKSSLRVRLVVGLKYQKNKELQRVRRRVAIEEGNRVNGKKGQVDWGFNKTVSPAIDAERSRSESQIRTELQAEYQKELSESKTKWEAEHVAVVRPQLENEIKEQLRIDYQNELSTFKTQWELEHLPSQTELKSQKDTVLQSQVEVDGPGHSGTAAAKSADDDMLLASLSRESDETHELFQEIARSGISPGSAANTVLRDLNQAKDALYDVKCELRNDVADKNNLLYSVGCLHVNAHYIQQLNTTTWGVLIRQANEANRRLEYVQRILKTNNDVPKDDMLRSLLSPLQTEPEPINISVHSQMTNGFVNTVAPGNSTFPPKANGLGKPAVRNTFLPPPTVNGFGDAATLGTPRMTTQGVFNPFENSHFASQPSLDPRPPNESRSANDGSASEAPQEDGDIHLGAPGFDLNSIDLGNLDSGWDWNSVGEIVRKVGAVPTITEPQISASEEPSSALSYSSMGIVSDNFSSHDSGKQPAVVTGDATTPAQNEKGSGASNNVTEAEMQQRIKFKMTPRKRYSRTDQQMDTDGELSSSQATQNNSTVAGFAFVSSRQRQANKVQGQSSGYAPKGRQLAHQAFSKKQNVSASIPTQAQQASPQHEVPTTQQVGSVGFPKKPFILESNHGFDLTPNTFNTERGSHLRVQQDPTEYQKPLTIFKIPEVASSTPEHGQDTVIPREGESADQSGFPGLITPQVEESSPEEPLGCEGWTVDMEKHANTFLKGADIEQTHVELCFLYPAAEHMTGLIPYLEKRKREIESQVPDPVQKGGDSEQPAGWTDEMTSFVEGSLCGGNDVRTTVNLFRLEVVEAFDIQGLEEHVEKLKNEYINKKNFHKPQDPVA